MCRRLKHIALENSQSVQLVEAIGNRLMTGQFSEQFKDQLRLAIALDAQRIFRLSRDCLSSPVDHIKAYAIWVLRRDER